MGLPDDTRFALAYELGTGRTVGPTVRSTSLPHVHRAISAGVLVGAGKPDVYRLSPAGRAELGLVDDARSDARAIVSSALRGVSLLEGAALDRAMKNEGHHVQAPSDTSAAPARTTRRRDLTATRRARPMATRGSSSRGRVTPAGPPEQHEGLPPAPTALRRRRPMPPLRSVQRARRA